MMGRVTTPCFILISPPLAAHQSEGVVGGCGGVYVSSFGSNTKLLLWRMWMEFNILTSLTIGVKIEKVYGTYTHMYIHTYGVASLAGGGGDSNMFEVKRGNTRGKHTTYLTVSPDVALLRLSEQSHLSGLSVCVCVCGWLGASVCINMSVCVSFPAYVAVDMGLSVCTLFVCRLAGADGSQLMFCSTGTLIP